MNQDFFLDRTGVAPQAPELWPAVVIPKEAIDAEIERLASLPRPANGRRRSLIAHPLNQHSHGLAPGIEVALDVLLPGERTVPYRQNSTQVNFVIGGQGHSVIGGKRFTVGLYDVWNTPSMHTYWHGNDGKESARPPDLLERVAARDDERAFRRGEPAGGRGGEARGDDGRGPEAPRQPLRHVQAQRGRRLSHALRGADQSAGGGIEGAALAVGGCPQGADEARGARQGLCRAAALSALQPDDRPHQRLHAVILRHHDDPAARHRRPAASPQLGGDQLLLPRHRPLDRRGQGPALEGGRPDAVGAGLGRPQPRLGRRRLRARAHRAGPAAQHRHGIACCGKKASSCRSPSWASRKASAPTRKRGDLR